MSVFQKFSIVLVGLGLGLLAYSHYRYGLADQQGLLLGIVPLLFAGLLLGRPGVWVTTAIYFCVLLIGSWADYRHGVLTNGDRDSMLSALLQPILGILITALILDRLILIADTSRRRSQDLALLYRRLQAEMAEKERSQAQLVHAQRMDALGKLASNVAHDFNNLLSIILGYASQGATDPASEARMKGIAAATRRGKHMTDKLMTLARTPSRFHETFDANLVLLELLPVIETLMGKHIQVTEDLCEQPAWVHLDIAEFEAIALNLAKNAVDAMPADGSFHIRSQIADRSVHLSFADTGCGMTPDVLQKIFEPFFTTKPAHEGTGIGLAVAHHMLMEAGGSISVESTPQQGSCFTLHLPLHTAPTMD